MKTILITGATGYIGSYLMHNLPQYNIIAVDNMHKQRYCSLFNLPKNITFIEQSFVNISNETLQKVDVVLHLASYTDATTSMKKEIEFEEVNVKLTKQFIYKCNSVKVPLFIFPSSCSVYGVSSNEVFEDSPKYLNPQSIYAQTKLTIEEMINFHLGKNGTKFLIVRFGTVFGHSLGIRYETCIPRFCYEARFNKPLNVWKETINMQRSYLGLEDIVQSLCMLLQNPTNWNQTYNVLSLNETCANILEYIRSIIPSVKHDLVDTPVLNQYSYIVNFDKIKSLGYMPKSNLEQDIKKTIQSLSLPS